MKPVFGVIIMDRFSPPEVTVIFDSGSQLFNLELAAASVWGIPQELKDKINVSIEEISFEEREIESESSVGSLTLLPVAPSLKSQ